MDTTPSTANSSKSAEKNRLLTIKDVADIMGICTVTASKIIKESGYGITLHRRVFILESSFYKYLQEMEDKVC